jgi:sugar (pentulose or hexulose) kinase
MRVLGLDIGSSSVKAGILRSGAIVGRVARVGFATRYDGARAEVDPQDVLRAIDRAIGQIPGAKSVDVIAMSVMSPSWIAMDARGKALTPIVTHQDRRSVDVAKALIAASGSSRFLRINGNLPFPGGISSTTWAWFVRNQRATMRRADLVGHLQTFLHRQMNGARVVDPSNASFMGVYETLKLGGWSEDLCDAIGAREHQLPQLIDANGVAGMVTRAAGRRFGLTHGTPMLVGCVDTSAAMLLAGARPGQLLNVSGSTDVLALCTDRPRPHKRLLTRALGIGRKWMSVSTLAAAGSTLDWARQVLFVDCSQSKFFELCGALARRQSKRGIRFEPYLAGERASIEQRFGAFSGLTLSTSREEMLEAIVESLAAVSAARIPLLKKVDPKLSRRVMLSGGAQSALRHIVHRDWPGKWAFQIEEEATLRGLALLAADS